MIYVLALLIGVVSGLRTFTAPAAVAWAAHLGWISLQGTPLTFLGGSVTTWILTVLALGEFIGDQLPQTPSRKVPMQFAARILSGALSGAAICASAGVLAGGLVAGVAGAVIGTLGGAEGRARLARAFGRDMPAAFIEDAIAIGAAILIVRAIG